MPLKLKSPGDYAGAIVVLAHNNIDLTERCLNSVFEQQLDGPKSILTILIDNGSTDLTSRYIRNTLLGRNDLLGYTFRPSRSVAACWNTALDNVFLNWQLPVALVVNNDTEIGPMTFRYMLDATRFTKQHQFVTCNSTQDRDLVYECDPNVAFAEPSPHPDFSCFMITRKCWLKVGKFDEQFAIAYCEDCDYHVRMHRKGIAAINLGIPYLHHASATVKNASDAERERISEQADINRKLFFAKWGKHIGTTGYDELFTDATFGIDAT